MNNLQRTEEWFEQRIGHLTASMAKDVIRYQKGEIVAQTPAKIEALKMRILSEQLTGLQVEDHFTADTRRRMQWGTEQEENAVTSYEIETGNVVLMSGFVKDSEIKYLGASPDGLVGADGLIEIKCPETTTHLSRILADEVPEDIKPQMLLQLIVTRRKWCDFVDYDPRCPQGLQLFIKRFEPTDEERSNAKRFFVEMLNSIEELKTKLSQI